MIEYFSSDVILLNLKRERTKILRTQPPLYGTSTSTYKSNTGSATTMVIAYAADILEQQQKTVEINLNFKGYIVFWKPAKISKFEWHQKNQVVKILVEIASLLFLPVFMNLAIFSLKRLQGCRLH